MFLKASPGRTCIINEQALLFCSGYSYLGMSQVQEFQDHVIEGLKRYGVLFPSSRNSNTQLELFNEVESLLSELTSQEDAVVFSSGYLAGQTISAVLSDQKNIHIAPGTHPAIQIKGFEIPELTFNEWAEIIVSAINDSNEHDFVLLADSVDIIKGVVRDFSFLQRIHSNKNITFLIDDSHGIGILGAHGEGIISLLPKLLNIEYILSFSLSKAFNLPAGAVSATKRWSKLLRSHPNYSASTSISPAMAFVFMESQELYRRQHKSLHDNILFLSGLIHNSDQQNLLPIFPGSTNNLAYLFFEKGIIISSFHYPYANSALVDRVIINASHTREDLSTIADVYNKICLSTS